LVKGTGYKLDAEGHPSGTENVLDTARAPQQPPSEPVAVLWEEPKSRTRYLLPASLGLLALAGVIWLVRRVREGRQRP
jgi:hypothetical protein